MGQRTMSRMDVDAFRRFLSEGGRSAGAARRAITYVLEYESYLGRHHVDLDDAGPGDLESFVAFLEADPKVSAKLNLWGLRYYYQFTDDPIMVDLASTMREERVRETPFMLRKFAGVNQATINRLADIGIRSTKQLLADSVTAAEREKLATRATISVANLEELVRLSDLARVSGLTSIRARLYFDCGVRSVSDMAGWDPAELAAALTQWVSANGFEGLAPFPTEVASAVASARVLPSVIEW